ncbi:MAG: IS1 family transposase, partial [Bacteroidetes bacterium]|nr:IS1 family transposase [Bacteroidota bacterium]
YSDYYKAYESIIQNSQHIQSKAETFTIEGYNSLFRHYLARMRRKTKYYSKCVKILEHSIRLLMLKRNKDLSLLN